MKLLEPTPLLKQCDFDMRIPNCTLGSKTQYTQIVLGFLRQAINSGNNTISYLPRVTLQRLEPFY